MKYDENFGKMLNGTQYVILDTIQFLFEAKVSLRSTFTLLSKCFQFVWRTAYVRGHTNSSF